MSMPTRFTQRKECELEDFNELRLLLPNQRALHRLGWLIQIHYFQNLQTQSSYPRSCSAGADADDDWSAADIVAVAVAAVVGRTTLEETQGGSPREHAEFEHSSRHWQVPKGRQW